MKKFILASMLFLAGFGLVNAQTTPIKKPVKTVKVTTATNKVVAPPAKPQIKDNAAGLKKDGTPDMRFKTNKTSKVVVAGPAKKDGTPDMRYKANKKK